MWNPETNIRGPVGPPGPPGVSTSRFFYRVDMQSTNPSDPGTGKYRYNNAVLADVTEIHFDNITQDGFDASLMFKLSANDDEFVIQDKDFSYNYQVWRMLGPGVQHPDWFHVPVEFVSAEGTGFSHNQQVAVLVRSKGIEGPEGPPGPEGPEGPPGPPGLSGAIVADTPPATTTLGSFWYESDSGLLYIRYQDPDGSSTPWVAVSGATSGGPIGPVGPQGVVGPQGPQGVKGDPVPIYVSDTPPPSPVNNMLWYESDSGTLLLRYQDTDSVQWISVFGGFTDMVRYAVAQGLTAPQQAQARANIGAAAPVAAVIYDAAQGLTAPQQVQARANIGAAQQTATPDAGWIPFAYMNGWVDYAAPYGPCGYRKLANGLVLLKGLVMNGTAASILTLPAGYRPGYQLLTNMQSNNVACRVDVTTAGIVQHTNGSNAWISLTGIVFLAEN